MKILVIHNLHRSGSASGDDQVFRNEVAMLRAHGHEVITYSVCNDEFDQANVFSKLGKTMGMLWSFSSAKKVRKLIREHRPEVVHVHTFFPLLSPSILYAAKRENCYVVATLHDTRFVCPGATSLCNGQLCNECMDGKYFRMAKRGCFKNSKLQSFYVACVFKYHRWRRTFYEQIDRYFYLNESQKQLLIQAGFDEKKLVKKYNFVPEKQLQEQEAEYVLPQRFVVFYGRLGEEKGMDLLMKLWDKPELRDIPLVIMGAGPMEAEIKVFAENHEQVHFLGYVPHEKCLSVVRKGEFVIFPSIWYEGCSMVEIETASIGKPILATRLGFSMELIEEGVNGALAELGNVDDFAMKLCAMWNSPEKLKLMGENMRKSYEKHFLMEENYKRLLRVYSENAVAIAAVALGVEAGEIKEKKILKNGMTNRTYLVEWKKEEYLIRIPGEGSEVLVNRENEKKVYDAIADWKHSDEVIFMDAASGCKVTRYIKHTRTCDARNQEEVLKCMKLLREFHEKNYQVGHAFDIYEELERYESYFENGISRYADYEEVKKKMYELRPYIEENRTRTCLCHIDANPDNFLMCEDEIRLIDWEYAGMQDPDLDIAMFGIYAGYDRKEMDELISSYYTEGCEENIRRKIHCYGAVCGLLWSNWCEYKESQGNSFGEYAETQYGYARDFSLEEMTLGQMDSLEQKKTLGQMDSLEQKKNVKQKEAADE